MSLSMEQWTATKKILCSVVVPLGPVRVPSQWSRVLRQSSLAETNDTPYNFAEGESDFVSGFNVEYHIGLQF